MRIAVCLEQVPDPQAPAGSFYVDEAANEPRWSPPAQELISTFDLHAIEAAAQIRETAGGHVTILTLGPQATPGQRQPGKSQERFVTCAAAFALSLAASIG
jgi:electron transfer flavoprotein alpha/beta subunit